MPDHKTRPPPQAAPSPAVELDDANQISAISCAFGHEILFGVALDLADWTASHANSAAISAWRGDLEGLGDHLQQASNAIKAALMVCNELEAELASAPA